MQPPGMATGLVAWSDAKSDAKIDAKSDAKIDAKCTNARDANANGGASSDTR